jgi:hypothetical protein
VPGITPALDEELRRALKVRRLPAGFADAIAEALRVRHEREQDDEKWQQCHGSLEGIVSAGVALKKAIARAEAVFGATYPLLRDRIGSDLPDFFGPVITGERRRSDVWLTT